MTGFPDRAQVVVCGAGPTGLTLANSLGRFGVNVLVVERNASIMDIPRAILIDDEGIRTVQAAGLDDVFVPMTKPGFGARYYDADGVPFAEVGPGPVEFGFPRRNYLQQPELEQVLLDGLARFEHASLRFKTELIGEEERADDILLTLQDADGERHQVAADYLVACDGARSRVRRRLGIGMQGDTYPEDWLIFDTHNDPDDEPVSKFFCRLDRPFVSIPAPKGGRRYEFRLRQGEDAARMLQPEAIRELLEPIRAFEAADLWRATVYTFEARLAERWRAGRVFLAGDAAHLTPPFAGQGMNAGLRDAQNLAWKLACVLDGAAGGALLDSYQGERRGPSWSMVQLAVAMGDIVMPSNPQDIAFRASILAWMDRFPESRDFIVGMKFKPPPCYDQGAFVDLNDQPFTGSMVGRMAPQPSVRDGEGKTARLDDLLGPGFALVAQSAETVAFLREKSDLLWPELSPAAVHIAGFPEGGPNAAAFRAHRDQILLIRPDRYVACAFWVENAATAVAAFREAMGR